MPYFAKLNDKNIVEDVIAISSDDLKKKSWWDPIGLFTGKKESESVGIALCQSICGDPTSIWKQTSYSAGNTGRGFRGNFAGIGMTYMTNVETMGVASTDVFVYQQPYPSWKMGITTATYFPPEPPGHQPTVTRFEGVHGLEYRWNESKYKKNPLTAWELVSRRKTSTRNLINN